MTRDSPPAARPSSFFCLKPTMISGFNSHGLNTALKIKAQTAIIESRRGGKPPQPVRRSWAQKKTVSGRDQTSSWHEEDSGRRLTAEVGSAGQTDHSRVDATLMMLMLRKKMRAKLAARQRSSRVQHSAATEAAKSGSKTPHWIFIKESHGTITKRSLWCATQIVASRVLHAHCYRFLIRIYLIKL